MTDDVTWLAALARDQYRAEVQAIQVLSGSLASLRAICRIDLRQGGAWLARVYRADQPVPDWLIGCGAIDHVAWLHTRATTLAYLEQVGYPAPRLIQTRDGAMVGERDGWCVLITTFVEGQVQEPTADSLQALGAALGRLHRLTLLPPGAPAPAVGWSWWHVDQAVPAILAQYAQVAVALPVAWRATFSQFCATVQIMGARQGLPQAIIHGDGWAGNLVQTSAGQRVLIDWEPAGLGLAILDLGRSLLYGHYDLDTPLSVPIQPSPWRINALIDGYCQQRVPAAAEQALLTEAIRFVVACGAASHFVRAHQGGWRNPAPEALRRRQHWYTVAAPIAELAHQQLGHYG